MQDLQSQELSHFDILYESKDGRSLVTLENFKIILELESQIRNTSDYSIFCYQTDLSRVIYKAKKVCDHTESFVSLVQRVADETNGF